MASLFTCCHPALPLTGQVALTLCYVAALTTTQIAAAFLVPEATMAKRLGRAKAKIAHAAIPLRVPSADRLGECTCAVFSVPAAGRPARVVISRPGSRADVPYGWTAGL